jgi:hypothetical protein
MVVNNMNTKVITIPYFEEVTKEDYETIVKELDEAYGFINELLVAIEKRFPEEYQLAMEGYRSDDIVTANDIIMHIINPAFNKIYEDDLK